MNDSRPEIIVELITKDLLDRRGFRQAWDACDEDIKIEISNAWLEIIKNQLR